MNSTENEAAEPDRIGGTLLPRKPRHVTACLADICEVLGGASRSSLCRALPDDFELRRVYRKWWELEYLSGSAEALGLLDGRRDGVGLGVGTEPLIYFFASRCHRVLATDQYSPSSAWSESRLPTLEHVYRAAPMPYPGERLEVQCRDMRSLGVPDASFDFAWSCSSVEHVPSLVDVLDVFRELARVVKVGGYVLLTTEFCLARPPYLLAGVNALDPELFDAVVRSLDAFELVGGVDLDYNWSHPGNSPTPRRYPPAGCQHPSTRSPMEEYRRGMQIANLVGISAVAPVGMTLRRRSGVVPRFEDLRLPRPVREYSLAVAAREERPEESLRLLRGYAEEGPAETGLQLYLHICMEYVRALSRTVGPDHATTREAIERCVRHLPPGALQDGDCLGLGGAVLCQAGDHTGGARLIRLAAESPSTTIEHAVELGFMYLHAMLKTGRKKKGYRFLSELRLDLLRSGVPRGLVDAAWARGAARPWFGAREGRALSRAYRKLVRYDRRESSEFLSAALPVPIRPPAGVLRGALDWLPGGGLLKALLPPALKRRIKTKLGLDRPSDEEAVPGWGRRSSRTDRESTRLLIDCTHTYFNGGNAGIQRVVRNVVNNCRAVGRTLGVECQPVVWSGRHFLAVERAGVHGRWLTPGHPWAPGAIRTITRRAPLVAHVGPVMKSNPVTRPLWSLAKGIVKGLLHAGASVALRVLHAKVVPGEGDVLLLPDATWNVPFWGAVHGARRRGAKVGVVVHDLIPLRLPNFSVPSHVESFGRWLSNVATHSDFLLTVSDAVRGDLGEYVAPIRGEAFARSRLASFRLGAELDGAGTPGRTRRSVAALGARSPYLMVSTIEPRKNHAYLLDAFDIVWEKDADAGLAIVGMIGWSCDTVVERIRRHPRWQKQLFMFNDLSDAELLLLYRQSKALVFPSVCEGFGLPIVEALKEGLPVIASDIPVHREVGGEHCLYFDLDTPRSLAALVLDLQSGRLAPPEPPARFDWPNWKESCRELVETVLDIA